MATTRLSDVVVPEVYQGYMTINTPELTAFWESGIVVENPLLADAARGPSNIVQVPFWKDLNSGDEPNISSDDPSEKSTPKKIDTGKQVGMVAYLNQSWSAMNLVRELAGSDPMGAIVAATNRYWARQWQKRLLAACVGIYLDNVASNDADMVYDITRATSGTPGDTNKFGGEAAIRTMVTMGDALNNIVAMAVHSTVYGRMLELDQIDFIQPSQTEARIPTYKNKMVIVDDGMPVEVDGNDNTIFTSMMFGPAIFGYGAGAPDHPVEVSRDPSSGNGGGEDMLTERRTWLLHPAGFAFDPNSVAGQSATIAELKQAAAWSRVVERKLVPLAYLRTNG